MDKRFKHFKEILKRQVKTWKDGQCHKGMQIKTTMIYYDIPVRKAVI
jgi:hypothetical protein